MIILVAGSVGMIGNNFVCELLNKGLNVIGVDKKQINYQNDYEHFEINLGSFDSLGRIFIERKNDKVINIAGTNSIHQREEIF